jgi:hypothetical protein
MRASKVPHSIPMKVLRVSYPIISSIPVSTQGTVCEYQECHVSSRVPAWYSKYPHRTRSTHVSTLIAPGQYIAYP